MTQRRSNIIDLCKFSTTDDVENHGKLVKSSHVFGKIAKITEESLQNHDNKWQLTALTDEFKVAVELSVVSFYSVCHHHNLKGEIRVCKILTPRSVLAVEAASTKFHEANRYQTARSNSFGHRWLLISVDLKNYWKSLRITACGKTQGILPDYLLLLPLSIGAW